MFVTKKIPPSPGKWGNSPTKHQNQNPLASHAPSPSRIQKKEGCNFKGVGILVTPGYPILAGLNQSAIASTKGDVSGGAYERGFLSYQVGCLWLISKVLTFLLDTLLCKSKATLLTDAIHIVSIYYLYSYPHTIISHWLCQSTRLVSRSLYVFSLLSWFTRMDTMVFFWSLLFRIFPCLCFWRHCGTGGKQNRHAEGLVWGEFGSSRLFVRAFSAVGVIAVRFLSCSR